MTIDKENIERRPATLGLDHWALHSPNGSITLHAREGCSGSKGAERVRQGLVDILWRANPPDVKWCMNCAIKRKRTKA